MADLRCPHCGEPWDLYHLNDVSKCFGVSFEEAYRLFVKYGCPVVEKAFDDDANLATLKPCQREPIEPPDVMDLIKMRLEADDDPDAAAADLDDMLL